MHYNVRDEAWEHFPGGAGSFERRGKTMFWKRIVAWLLEDQATPARHKSLEWKEEYWQVPHESHDAADSAFLMKAFLVSLAANRIRSFWNGP